MKKTKFLALVMAVVMLCSLFSGCSLFDGKTILTVDGKNISEDIYSSALALAESSFYNQNGVMLREILDVQLGENMTGADILKQYAESILCELEAARIIAEQNGLGLTDEEKAALEADKQSQIEEAGGKRQFLAQLRENGTTEAATDYLTEITSIYSKVYSELFSGEGALAPKVEDVATKLMNDYVRVKHVLVLSSEGAEDEAEKRAKAEGIAKRAKAGEDFDKLIKEFGEDPGMESNPEGYILDKDGFTPEGSRMVEEFSTASNALAVNGVSDVVKTTHGFHIIKRFPITEEYVAENSDTYVGLFTTLAFQEQIRSVMENIKVKYKIPIEKIDVHKILGIEKTLGAGIEAESDGHDHGEAESEETETTEVVPAE